ncbi:MAG: hypothetical protein GY715_20105 [Planctomycetes bacterium]|nr:hypothetical protein [Planctomycetota bacterium]
MGKPLLSSIATALVAVAMLTTAPAAAGPPCLGDLNGNGLIGFDDVLMIVAQWGPTEPCPPHAPEDLSFDCAVNFADILVVIANWGVCEPPPFGACCLLDGTCIDTLEVDCQAQSGEFIGAGIFCELGMCEG